MAEERTQRRLAAILAADVVGYSRLMAADETGTLAALKTRRRDILQPAIARHRGRIVKVMGDGVLIEFASAVDAVECAVALQEGMESANDGLPEDRRIVLRVGINLGDVIVEGGDLYGDGVNIAARLEGVAEPGRILISGTTYDHVKNKVDVGFDDLGTQTLKNLAEPVRAYRVANTAAASPVATKSAADKPSIAVLPFTNMSDDPGQEYFSDGITEDIITELSRNRDLLVIARHSSFVYKGRAVNVRDIGRELGVQYLVEGSVRRSGARVRVTAQLIEAATVGHLWANRYDRDLSDIFAVQDELVRTIVGTIAGRLETAGIDRAKRKPTESLAAYDCVLRAMADLYGAYDRANYAEKGTNGARKLLTQAIALDAKYARAYAALAFASMIDWWYFGVEADIEQAYAQAQKAVALDPDDGYCRSILGQACTYSRRHAEARIHLEQAMDINPNDAYAMGMMGIHLNFIGKYDEAIAWLRKTLELSPIQRDLHLEDLGFTYYSAGQYKDSVDAFSRISHRPHWVHAYLAAAYAMHGQIHAARREARQVQPWPAPWNQEGAPIDREFPAVPKALIAYLRCYEDEETFRNWIDGFHKAGLPV
jgi:adenylate cyclase